jgi:predicted  nucleic acid-binding Zn-ribbon protein
LTSRLRVDSTALDTLVNLLASNTVFDTLCEQHDAYLEAVCAHQVARYGDHSRPSSSSSSGTRVIPVTKPSRPLLHPLPPHVAQPQSYQRMIDCGLQLQPGETIGDWQRRVCDFLSQATLSTLASLNERCLRGCIERWACLIGSEDWADSLNARYVAGKLQRHYEQIQEAASSAPFSSPLPPDLRSWIEKCHRMCVSGTKVAGFVRYALMYVLQLCRDPSNEASTTIADAVARTGDMLVITTQHCQGAWEAECRPLAEKLVQKFATMPPALQRAMVHVLVVFEPRTWIKEAVTILPKAGHAVLHCHQKSERNDYLSLDIHALFDLAHFLAGQQPSNVSMSALSQFARDIFGFVLDQCQPSRPASPDRSVRLEQALAIVEECDKRIADFCPEMTDALLLAIVEIGIPDWWVLDLTCPGEPQNCQGLPSCPHQDELRRSKLCDRLSLQIVSTAACRGVRLPVPMVELLHRRLMPSVASTYASCIYTPFKPLIHENPSRRIPEINSRNWRLSVSQFVAGAADEVQCVVEDSVTAICKDLQDRCDNVEIPLRAAEQEARDLQGHVSSLQDQLAAEVSKSQSLQATIDHTQKLREEDAANLEKSRQALRLQGEQLTLSQAREASLTSDLEEAKEEYSQKLAQMLHQIGSEAAGIRVRAATKIDELEGFLASKTHTISVLEAERVWLKEQMDLAKADLIEAHKHELSQIEDEHARDKASDMRMVEELRSSLATAADERQVLEKNLHERDLELQKLSKEQEASKVDISQLQTEIEAKAVQLAEQQAKLHDMSSENADLVQQLSEQQDEAISLRNRVSELEEASSKWQDRCGSLERSLKDARAREEGIQALLGGRPRPATGRRATTTMMKESSQNMLPERRRREQSTGSFEVDDDDDDDDDPSYEIVKLG